MNPLVRIALAIAQMPDATVAELEKSLPGFTQIAAGLKALGPDIATASPHIDALIPIFSRTWPTIQLLYSVFAANLGTIEDLIKFVQK